jgi:hypothetical protein
MGALRTFVHLHHVFATATSMYFISLYMTPEFHTGILRNRGLYLSVTQAGAVRIGTKNNADEKNNNLNNASEEEQAEHPSSEAASASVWVKLAEWQAQRRRAEMERRVMREMQEITQKIMAQGNANGMPVQERVNSMMRGSVPIQGGRINTNSNSDTSQQKPPQSDESASNVWVKLAQLRAARRDEMERQAQAKENMMILQGGGTNTHSDPSRGNLSHDELCRHDKGSENDKDKDTGCNSNEKDPTPGDRLGDRLQSQNPRNVNEQNLRKNDEGNGQERPGREGENDACAAGTGQERPVREGDAYVVDQLISDYSEGESEEV